MRPSVAVHHTEAASACLIKALKLWRMEYAPAAAYDSLMALHIHLAKVQHTIYPAGRTIVHVRIEGKQERNSDDYFFDTRMRGGKITIEGPE